MTGERVSRSGQVRRREPGRRSGHLRLRLALVAVLAAAVVVVITQLASGSGKPTPVASRSSGGGSGAPGGSGTTPGDAGATTTGTTTTSTSTTATSTTGTSTTGTSTTGTTTTGTTTTGTTTTGTTTTGTTTTGTSTGTTSTGTGTTGTGGATTPTGPSTSTTGTTSTPTRTTGTSTGKTGPPAGGTGTSTTTTPTGEFSPTLPAFGIAAGSVLQTWAPASLARQLNDYARLHATWIRHDFAWNAIEPLPGRFEWAGFDRLVSASRSRHLNVIATIGYTPPWANGGHADARYAPTSDTQFAHFAGQVAARYAPDGVHVYEIWNEPNIQYWQPKPDPSAYAALLCAAYSAIHAADPKAIVLTGGISPAANSSTTFAPQSWLSDLYADGAGHCFDAVAYHPYVDSVKAHAQLGGNWYLMYTNYANNLRAVMTSHGDAGMRIWATEVGCNRQIIGDAECAFRIREALALWKTYSWAGVLCWFTYWDPNAYGLVDGLWHHRPEWAAYRDAAAGAG